MLNPGDISLVPDPVLPGLSQQQHVRRGRRLHDAAGAGLGFRPDLDAIPADVSTRARLMFLNYPNNPTGGDGRPGLLREGGRLGQAAQPRRSPRTPAYNEMYFEAPAPSLLQVPGAKDVGIEFHSLSKTFNMTGWRVGFAVGDAESSPPWAR